MKTDNKKICRVLCFSVSMTVVSIIILVLGMFSDWFLLSPLGMIGVLVFGDELIAIYLPIRRHLLLKKALRGLDAKALTDWFVRDASSQEQTDFLAYLHKDCLFDVFREWNTGLHYYQRVAGFIKYEQALIKICQAGESKS